MKIKTKIIITIIIIILFIIFLVFFKDIVNILNNVKDYLFSKITQLININ